jgi:hypothetical protein
MYIHKSSLYAYAFTCWSQSPPSGRITKQFKQLSIHIHLYMHTHIPDSNIYICLLNLKTICWSLSPPSRGTTKQSRHNVYIYIHICTHIYMYIHTCTSTYVHTHILFIFLWCYLLVTITTLLRNYKTIQTQLIHTHIYIYIWKQAHILFRDNLYQKSLTCWSQSPPSSGITKQSRPSCASGCTDSTPPVWTPPLFWPLTIEDRVFPQGSPLESRSEYMYKSL